MTVHFIIYYYKSDVKPKGPLVLTLKAGTMVLTM